MKLLNRNMILSISLILLTGACQNKKTLTAEEDAKLDQEEINRPSEIWPTNKDKNGDYYYYVSLNSFPGCLGEDAGSTFIAGKEEVRFLTMENDAWTTTTGAVLNDEYHPVPDSLYVRWFSVSEDKFYEGKFKMPSQIIKAHLDEIWLTYGSSNKQIKASKYERFKNLIVGVTPGGGVMVWMKSLYQQIEIGHYQAKEIQMDWDKFAGINNFGEGSTHEQFLKSQKDNITLPVPFGKAEKYRDKFSWKCGTISNSRLKTVCFQMLFFNGENEAIYDNSRNSTNDFTERTVPATMNFLFQAENRRILNFEVSFDEEDIYEAFQTICINKNTGAKLVLELDSNNKFMKIALHNRTQEYVLSPNKIHLFSRNYKAVIEPIKEN